MGVSVEPRDERGLKDQYFGDINDYHKYGLLRAITEAVQMRVGVCWLRTADDSRTDGALRSYLHQPDRWRHFDPPLYDGLRKLLDPGIERSATHAEAWGLIPDAGYQHRFLTDVASDRTAYFAESWSLLRDCPVIFFDPDNGIEVKSVRRGRPDSAKYLFWSELKEAAACGHSVLVYQHFPRVVRDQFAVDTSGRLHTRLGSPWVSVFRTAHVAFFLVPHENHADRLAAVSPLIEKRWPGQFEVARHNPGA